MTLTYAEFCAGYGGLGLAVEEVFGAKLAWYSEFEAAPSKIMAHHWPDAPNHGDMTTIDFAAVEPVDILSGGTPCQDLSHAGRRAGMRTGTRSGLWESMREAIATIRPKYVVWENVRGAYSAGASSDADSEVEPFTGRVGAGGGQSSLRALGRVLGDLADLGFDAEWRGLRAADVGAPHGRFRVFVLATRRDVADAAMQRREEQQQPASSTRTELPANLRDHALLPKRGHDGRARGRDGRFAPLATQPAGVGRVQGRAEHARIQRGSNAAERGTPTPADAPRLGPGEHVEPCVAGLPAATGASSAGTNNWGPYAPAIARWEAVRGTAPAPTVISGSYLKMIARRKAGLDSRPVGLRGSVTPTHRLSADFAEWMMGIPAGWVTDPAIGISRNEQLKAIGNGVVPAQAAAALRHMLNNERRTP